MARDEDYTKNRLARFLPTFYNAALNGVRDSFSKYADTAHIHRVNTRRSITRDHIVDYLRADLGSDPEVKITDRNQTTYFDICREYKLMAKMADEDGLVALNQTGLSFSFQGQGQLFSEDEAPAVTNLYLSYVPSLATPDDTAVLLVCPNNGGVEWAFEIEPPAAEIAGTVDGGIPPAGGGEDDLVRVPLIKKPDETT
jgi:hypothetical protein